MPRPAYPNFPSAPSRERIDDLFALQRAADPRGRRLHLAAAAFALFLAPFPTTIVEWAILPLLMVFAIRMWTHHRVIGPLYWDWVVRLAVAFAAWMLLSAMWSAGGSRWIDDAHNLRYILFIPLLYPVLDRAPVLIASLMLGFLCAEGSQLVHLISLELGHPIFHRDPRRISGWLDPVVAGSLLTAALGLFLGAWMPHALMPSFVFKSLPRHLQLLGVATTLAAILLTGTRGAWIASIILLTIAAFVAAIRMARGTGGRARVFRFSVAVGLFLGIIVAVAASSDNIRSRFDRGVSEVRAALASRDYSSDTGQRIGMALWAVREFQDHPIRGVGAGGFQPYAKSPEQREETARRVGFPPPPKHAHAHSWPLHTLATLGLVGFALLAALMVTAIRSAAKPALPVALALLGLTLAGLFDTIHVNHQTAYLLFALLALSVSHRPSVFAPPRPAPPPPKEFRRPDTA